MIRSLAFLALVTALTILVVPAAHAGKPVPPPPPPKIVGLVSLVRAVAADGTVHDFAYQNSSCAQSLTSAVVVGHLFPLPQASPISATWQTGIGMRAVLENGDLWILNESCCTACYQMGTFMGNIFAAAGSRVPDFPTLSAPAVADPDAPEAAEPEVVWPGVAE